MGVGALAIGAVAQATSVRTALIVVAAGLAAALLLTWLLPLPAGNTAIEHAADPLPLPEELTEAFGEIAGRGPVAVTVSYPLAPDSNDAFLAHAKALRRMRRRTGAIHWHLHQDIDDQLLYTEMFVTASWDEHQHQHARTEHADQQLLAGDRRAAAPRGQAHRAALGDGYLIGGGSASALASSAGSQSHAVQACRSAERAKPAPPRADPRSRRRRSSRARTRRARRPSVPPPARAAPGKASTCGWA